MKKRLSILNLASVLLVIVVNYVSQAIRINETTIGEVSNKYFNLFTPASYAFAIWGLIFLALIAYGSYQVKLAFFSQKPSSFIEETGYWFALANLLNCIWVFVFAYEYTGLSVLVMLGILYTLLRVILNTNMAKQSVSRSTYILGWLPIGIYAGWITVATVANVSAYLAKLNWSGGFLSPSAWTITMIIVATLVYLIMIFRRRTIGFTAVGIWALVAIYIRHQNEYASIAYTALICVGIILVAILWAVLKIRTSGIISSSK